MTNQTFKSLSRRRFLAATGAVLASPALAQEDAAEAEAPVYDPLRPPPEPEPPVRRNISAFRSKDWRPYFDHLKRGAILVDLDSRALHYWSEDETTYKLFPSSVPLTEDLTRRGRTEIIRKVEGPGWAPTPSMRKRNPEWPEYIPPGPGQSAWHACSLPELAVLPDPWNARYAQDWQTVFERLHRAL